MEKKLLHSKKGFGIKINLSITKVFGCIRKVILTFLVITVTSCNSQEINRNSIKGNWYLLSNDSSKSINYQEVFIDGDKIYYFNDHVGLMPSNKYVVKNNTLFIIDNGSKEMIEMGKLVVLNNAFSLKGKKGKIVYRKIDDSPNLQDYITKKVSEDNYWDAFFSRLNKWRD